MIAAKLEIDALRQDSTGGTIDLTRFCPEPPEIAVAEGLFPAMMAPPQGNGMMPLPVPLCWSHMLSISLQETALQLGSPAMLGGGPGGAYLLGQGG